MKLLNVSSSGIEIGAENDLEAWLIEHLRKHPVWTGNSTKHLSKKSEIRATISIQTDTPAPISIINRIATLLSILENTNNKDVSKAAHKTLEIFDDLITDIPDSEINPIAAARKSINEFDPIKTFYGNPEEE